MSKDVLVLAGGLSYERDVSLRSGRRVGEALREAGYETTIRDADAQLLDVLAQDRPDAVFIAMHGATGEDGALRGILDLMNLPYIGTTAQASRVAWDKPSAKAALVNAGLSTPDWLTLPKETFRELGAPAVLDLIKTSFGLPVMVKPAQGGSGLGAVAVHEPEQLPAALVGSFGYGDTALIERYVEGIDIAVSIVTIDGRATRTTRGGDCAPRRRLRLRCAI